MKWSIKNYSHPTPIKIRRYADSFLSACNVSAFVSLYNSHPSFGIMIGLAGFIAKFLSDFYAEGN